MPHGSGAPPPGERLRTLRGLAGYACGHTGSCCRAGWPIPIEPAPLSLLRQAEIDARLPSSAVSWFNDGVLGHSAELDCAFYASVGSVPSCRLEQTLSADALPFSCRQFPRLLLRDARGWHMSLSAWCGTAAAMLSKPRTPTPELPDVNFLSIDHISVDRRVHVEALDAHDAWPPLLKPGVLAGHDTYERWETRLLHECFAPVASGRGETSEALAGALVWTDQLRQWRASDGCLFVLAGRPIPTRGRSFLTLRRKTEFTADRLQHSLMADVPTEWQAPNWPAGLTNVDLSGVVISRGEVEAALARYLGTRLIGNWVAYQGQGLRSVLASLVSAHALAGLALSMNGVGPITLGRLTSALRASDWLLLHLLDREQWAAWCSQWEAAPDASALVALVAATQRVLDSLSWADLPTTHE